MGLRIGVGQFKQMLGSVEPISIARHFIVSCCCRFTDLPVLGKDPSLPSSPLSTQDVAVPQLSATAYPIVSFRYDKLLLAHYRDKSYRRTLKSLCSLTRSSQRSRRRADTMVEPLPQQDASRENQIQYQIQRLT